MKQASFACRTSGEIVGHVLRLASVCFETTNNFLCTPASNAYGDLVLLSVSHG